MHRSRDRPLSTRRSTLARKLEGGPTRRTSSTMLSWWSIQNWLTPAPRDSEPSRKCRPPSWRGTPCSAGATTRRCCSRNTEGCPNRMQLSGRSKKRKAPQPQKWKKSINKTATKPRQNPVKVIHHHFQIPRHGWTRSCWCWKPCKWAEHGCRNSMLWQAGLHMVRTIDFDISI